MSCSNRFDLSRRRSVCMATLVFLTGTALADVSPTATAPQGAAPAAEMPLPPPGPGAKLRPPPLRDANQGVARMASGRITHWLQNPNGDIDGLILEDGTQVILPPTPSASLTQRMKLRDTVQVTGVRDGEAAGKRVLRASQIRDAAGKTVSLLDGESGNAPPVPPGHAALTPMTANGRVTTLLYTGRGDVNGVLLNDGTAVRFPPHVGAELAPNLKVGAPLFAKGYGTRNGQGSSLEATRLGASESSARDVFVPPRRLEAPRPGTNEGPQDAGVDAPVPPLAR